MSANHTNVKPLQIEIFGSPDEEDDLSQEVSILGIGCQPPRNHHHHQSRLLQRGQQQREHLEVLMEEDKDSVEEGETMQYQLPDIEKVN